MNDLHHPCESWAERVSLAAAGCLPADEEAEVRQHIETCPDCRERFRQLTQLCGALAEARLPADVAEAAIVARIMSAVVSDHSRPIVRTRAEMIHAALPTRSRDYWRWIMRRPMSRIAAAAIFVLAVGGVVLWFHATGTTLVLADFIEPIVDAKTARFKTTFEIPGEPPLRLDVLFLAPCRTRTEQEAWSNEPKMITIEDREAGKRLTLVPGKKLAELQTAINKPSGTQPKNLFSEMRSLLLDARDSSDFNREPLGKKEIDGRPAVGYRLTGRGQIINVWGDPKTGLPIRLGMSMPAFPNLGESTATFSDFVLNVDLDESLFSLEPPAGYKIEATTYDASPASEADLIESLRRYSQLSGGAFPDVLDEAEFYRLFFKDWQKSHPRKRRNPSDPQTQEERQARVNELTKFTKGLLFAFDQLPPQADAHYAGKGVSLGAADKPIFWYRPKDAKQYRVMYGDLSVRPSDTPPRVPDAQPVPAPPAAKK